MAFPKSDFKLGGIPVVVDDQVPQGRAYMIDGKLVTNREWQEKHKWDENRDRYYKRKEWEKRQVLDQANKFPNANRLKRLKQEAEEHFEEMWENRHDYPMWPHVMPMDDWDEAYHGPIRKAYYKQMKFMLVLLREFRNV